jgi:SAM-dependent methyltransferase
MDATVRGQVTRDAADVYEEFFVPALFLEWAAPVSDAGAISSGLTVLDVACGTGVLAREAMGRVRPGGAVVGLDRNEGMLAVARRTSPGIEWKQGEAESLPFADERFDVVVSQFGLMFFDDRVTALKEMWRVLRPGGRLAVTVWDALDRTPGYAAMTALLQRLFGEKIADALRAPFILGDPEALLSLFTEAGIPNAQIETRDGTARFPSIQSWVHTDVKGWTLADLIDDAQYDTLQRVAPVELESFVQENGTVEFRSPAHIVTATKS